MSKKTVSVEIESTGYDLIEATANLYKAVKAAGAFSAASIPLDIAALVAELPAIVAAAEGAKADITESKEEFLKGVNLAGYDLFDAIKG